MLACICGHGMLHAGAHLKLDALTPAQIVYEASVVWVEVMKHALSTLRGGICEHFIIHLHIAPCLTTLLS